MNGKLLQRRFVGGVIGLLVGTLSVCVTPAARAQYSANFQTNVISGVVSNWVGNSYIVGSNTFLDVLQILNGGALVNGTGYLGYETSGSNNAARITGSGSVWSNFVSLYIGYNGAGNQLTITNGGRVNSPTAYMGYWGPSSNNVVLVSGTGSVWNTSFLNIGRIGGGNQLIITNGGAVYGGGGPIGDLGDGNMVVVSGTGSVLHSAGTVGNIGSGNRLTITGGGGADGGMYIGGNGTSSSNNIVTVSGAGSVWTNGGGLSVGYTGPGNQLIITNGGMVYGGSFSFNYIGYNMSASNNTATITGTGSVWTCGSSLEMGEITTASSNRLTVSNGGAVLVLTWGYIGRFTGNNAATVSDPGSVLSVGNQLYVGLGGTGNSLVISNGAKVADPHGYVGGDAFGIPTCSNNSVAVTGSGSVWSNLIDVYIGGSGPNNSLTITNGGSTYSGSGFIGYAHSGSNNAVLVAGTGATWTDNGNLYVGYDGSSNRLTIAANASVVASNAYISYKSDAVANQINVAGGSFYVTNAAHNAVLDVRCGQVTVSSGLLQVDILIVTNACGHFNHTGGTLIYNSLILDPNLDADGDGLPNGWEQAHGLDPLSGGGNDGPSGDPDGDGFTNLQEFLAGTDPTNSASSFRITSVVSTGSDVLVSWMTGIGKTNALQVTAGGSYATNSFADLFIVTNTIGTTTNYLDVGGATNSPARYYRVRLVP